MDTTQARNHLIWGKVSVQGKALSRVCGKQEIAKVETFVGPQAYKGNVADGLALLDRLTPCPLSDRPSYV
jgi:hypothetical protein